MSAERLDIQLPSDLAYGLRVEGNDLAPHFLPGDTLVVDPAGVPEPGDFVVVWPAGAESKAVVCQLPEEGDNPENVTPAGTVHVVMGTYRSSLRLKPDPSEPPDP
jgi:hypothetical protein